MYKDLIKRLRECSTYGFKQEICGEAADAIELLWKMYVTAETDATNLTGELVTVCAALDYTKRKRDAVKHGRWVNHLADAWGAFNCSICGESTDDTCMGKPIANYCPNCGAKMDLEG